MKKRYLVSSMMLGLVMGLGSVSASAEGTNAFAGRQLFNAYCFVCHGVEGKGNGPLASQLPKRPANLSDNSRMMNRSDAQLLRIISGTADHGIIREAMPRWDLALSEPQIKSVIAYVRVLHNPAVKITGNPENGKNIYDRYCIACHGVNGKGDGVMAQVLSIKPANHTDAAEMSAISNKELLQAIKSGTDKMMPAWSDILNDKEMEDLVGYIRLLSN